MRADRPPPGLKAIRDAREARAQSAKLGRWSLYSSHNRLTPQVWLFIVSGMAAVLAGYWVMSERSLHGKKDALLAQQRAAAATVGAEWTPLRNAMESFTLESAGTYAGDFIAPEATAWDFRSLPGVYLRLPLASAKDAKTLREAAADSAKDGFVGCLLRSGDTGAAHSRPDASVVPDQPWNLRQAYAASRSLTDEWVSHVREADGDIALRVYEQQYEKAKKEELPLAIDMIKRAKFFLFVLDEEVPEASSIAGDAGIMDKLQLVAHPARVHLVDLRSKRLVARVRRTGQASFVFAGEQAVMAPEVRDAMQRQVNNCSLAEQFWSALRKTP